MKKALLIIACIVILIAIIIGAYLAWYYWIQPWLVYEFELEDYAYYLEKFPCDEVVGPIANADEAREKGVAVLIGIFGEEKILREKPFVVGYDNTTNTWRIIGSLSPFPIMFGGVAHIIINGSDGKVLAVWHTK